MTPEQERFNTVYNQYYTGIRQRAYEILGNFEDAEEVANDVLVKFNEHQGKVPDENLTGWLMTVTRHRSIDKIRQQAHKPKSTPDEEINEIADPRTHVEETVIARETHQIIKESLNQLGVNSPTTAYRLCFIDNYTPKKAAEIMNCHYDTIKVNIHRCRKRLNKIIESRYRT